MAFLLDLCVVALQLTRYNNLLVHGLGEHPRDTLEGDGTGSERITRTVKRKRETATKAKIALHRGTALWNIKLQHQKPIIFVAHTLGGIIVRDGRNPVKLIQVRFGTQNIVETLEGLSFSQGNSRLGDFDGTAFSRDRDNYQYVNAINITATPPNGVFGFKANLGIAETKLTYNQRSMMH
ncbi:hypothetical protein OIDMADRAFT_52273 [Oidiodendron maius Zn]|uniref:Uncharacterized protein n=1 Tax=Oidiodendron maius (strain Zn) TaxID=913774 RepID=A0A0C3H7Z6_OIDMZ|nr:hypothetical protein OIDMADRAFT_52273 [Oidiodendron maius Zn]